MQDFILGIYYYFSILINELSNINLYIYVVPVIIFIELPLYILIIASIFRKLFDYTFNRNSSPQNIFKPKVTCIVTCYNEEESVIGTIKSLTEQLYDGVIEILIVIDDAVANHETYKYALSTVKKDQNPKRVVKIVPKKTRGGLVSSRNIGLKLSTGDIVIAVDGDCSCDNDMVYNITRNFYDRNVIAVSGGLRVRNFHKNILTKLQGFEYILGIQIGRLGLARMNIINNVSGAFGGFRKEVLSKIGGWRNGTAEDLDLTIRMKALTTRYPKTKIDFNERAIIHTDVPDSVTNLIKQRIRWEGDLLFIYFSRYWKIIRPKFFGWKIFLGMIWYNILFCVIAPPATVFYMLYLSLCFAPQYVLAVLVFLYLYYLLISSTVFIIYLIVISERKKEDFKHIWLLLLIPVYQFVMKIIATLAFIIQLCLKMHRNSSMAPWWVLRKTEK